ncbi:GntR family transcriptional regulator [Parasphingorhabdus sp. JC815]|uniref:GntR family transcriptional regulator n=1 Tax=Parasphingorhabdus sp. JC815 TaxID=3232140 RepID=UPI00345979C5
MNDKIDSNAAVDRKQAVPLYHQIYLQLREEITSGERPLGSRLPTEHELSEEYDVSRITARRALDELADNSFVERKRRVGTHVIYRSPASPIQGNIHQLLQSQLDFGHTTEVKFLETEMVSAQPPINEVLKLPIETPVFRVALDRWLDGLPLGHFVSYLPSRFAKSMTRKKLKTMSMLALLEDAGAEIGAAHQTISATCADPPLSSSLQVGIGSPILRVTRTVFDIHGQPVQHIFAQFRPDRYQIRLDLDSPHGLRSSHTGEVDGNSKN